LVPPSGTVNLAELAADGAASGDEQHGELRVLPAPGVPDPGVVMAHRARQDLAGRLDLDVTEIEVVAFEPLTWPDVALGCPAEGGAYSSVLTPGYRVTLVARGSDYTYHTDRDLAVVLCRDGRPVD
jgi:hypothetical protein